MAANLITLPEAKDHLRITTTVDDVDLQRKVDQASDVIRDYLKTKNDPTWTDATVPPFVKASVCLMLTHLWDHRGEDQAPDAALWDAITRLLARTHPYSIA